MNGTDIISANLLAQEESLLYDIATERLFLSMLMRDPGRIVLAERAVPPEWLFRSSSQYIYRCMLYIYWQSVEHGWPLRFDDMAMLRVAEFVGRRDSFLAETKNLQYVRDLMTVAQTVDLAQWAPAVHSLRDTATRVGMYRQSRMIQEQVLNRKANPDARTIAMAAESAFLEASLQGGGDAEGGLRKLSEAADYWWRLANIAVANKGVRGLFNIGCSLFPRWMHLMNGGFRRKSLSVIAARAKAGKSTSLQEIARCCACVDQTPTLVLDTEMSRQEVWTRSLSAQSGVREFDLLSGAFLGDTGEARLVTEGMAALNNAPLYYCPIAGKPPEYALSLMQQFRNHVVGTRTVLDAAGQPVEATGLGLIIYDWIKLPDIRGLQYAQEYQLLGDLVSKIKDAAGRLDLPVVAGAQGNRETLRMTAQEFINEGERGVSGSDKITHFCNVLCLLRNLRHEEQEKVAQLGLRPGTDSDDSRSRLAFNQLLHVLLQRNGPDCREGIPLYLRRGWSQYTEEAYLRDPQTGQYQQDANGRHVPNDKVLAMVRELSFGRKRGAKQAEPPADKAPPKGPVVQAPQNNGLPSE